MALKKKICAMAQLTHEDTISAAEIVANITKLQLELAMDNKQKTGLARTVENIGQCFELGLKTFRTLMNDVLTAYIPQQLERTEFTKEYVTLFQNDIMELFRKCSQPVEGFSPRTQQAMIAEDSARATEVQKMAGDMISNIVFKKEGSPGPLSKVQQDLMYTIIEISIKLMQPFRAIGLEMLRTSLHIDLESPPSPSKTFFPDRPQTPYEVDLNEIPKLPGSIRIFGDMFRLRTQTFQEIIDEAYIIAKESELKISQVNFFGSTFLVLALPAKEVSALLRNRDCEKGDIIGDLKQVLGEDNIFVKTNAEAHLARAKIWHKTGVSSITGIVEDQSFGDTLIRILREILPETPMMPFNVEERMTYLTTSFFGETMLGIREIDPKDSKELARIFGETLATLASTSLVDRVRTRFGTYYTKQAALLQDIYQRIYNANIVNIRKTDNVISHNFQANQQEQATQIIRASTEEIQQKYAEMRENLAKFYAGDLTPIIHEFKINFELIRTKGIRENPALKMLPDLHKYLKRELDSLARIYDRLEKELSCLGLLDLEVHMTRIKAGQLEPAIPLKFDTRLIQENDPEYFHEVGLLHAGQETSTRALDGGIFVLAKYPEIRRALKTAILSDLPDLTKENFVEKMSNGFLNSQRTYLHRFLLELYRLYGSVPQALRAFPRGGTINHVENDRPYTITIPAGTQCLIPMQQNKMDPEKVGPEPERFDPDRALNQQGRIEDYTGFVLHNTFLEGLRKCPGQELVHRELKMALAYMACFYDFELKSDPGRIITQGTLRFERDLLVSCTELPGI